MPLVPFITSKSRHEYSLSYEQGILALGEILQR